LPRPWPKPGKTEAALAAAFDNEVARRLVLGTGVAERRIDSRFCASDYCEAAAKKLLADLGWDPLTISHLVFVSETPDYPLPATACILQFRLGISTDCTCFDVNLGCSGYTHGLWILARMLSPGQRGLLLVGDTLAKIVSPDDRSLVPLIGDGGGVQPPLNLSNIWLGVGTTMHFVGGTNGADFRSIIVNAGQCRFPASETTAIRKAGPDGVIRSEENLYMNGAEVFTFALREVAGLVHQTMELAGWQVSDVDDFVFHQANGFMLSNLANNFRFHPQKCP
jgi:3-oxoacyl-[acyl-carrier-protein] synthase-3